MTRYHFSAFEVHFTSLFLLLSGHKRVCESWAQCHPEGRWHHGMWCSLGSLFPFGPNTASVAQHKHYLLVCLWFTKPKRTQCYMVEHVSVEVFNCWPFTTRFLGFDGLFLKQEGVQSLSVSPEASFKVSVGFLSFTVYSRTFSNFD